MKRIAIYAEQPDDKAFKAAVKKAKGDEDATVHYRSLHFFNPKQPENFDVAIVDLSHPKSESVAKALESWGVEVAGAEAKTQKAAKEPAAAEKKSNAKEPEAPEPGGTGNNGVQSLESVV